MSKRYTLEECYTVLDVHPKTFKRWLKDDHISTETSKADKRIKFLTEEQVKQLAELHDKPWPPTTSQEVEVIPVTAYKLLIEQVARVERQIEQISTAQATLEVAIGELRKQQEDAVSQLDAIRQEQARRTEAERRTTQPLSKHEEQLAALQETLEGYQQQTRTELDNLAGGQQEGAARLDVLAEASQEQQQQLAQVTQRLDTLENQVQHIQKEMQALIEQAEQRLQAQFQSDLTALRQEFEQRAQGTQLEVQMQGETQEPTPERPVSTRRRAVARRVMEVEPTTET